MAKSATQIVDQALTLIDEQVTDALNASTTEMSVADMAKSVLPQVARDLIKELPYEMKQYLSETAVLAVDALSAGEDQSAYDKQKVAYVAPTDFWELVAIKLPSWARVVTDYILIDGSNYDKQNNPFLRGGPQNPVVAISQKGSGAGMRIECFSIPDGGSTSPDVFQYVSFDNVPDDSGNTWPDELFDEISKAVASELHAIKERIDQATLRGDDVLIKLEQHE